MQQEKSSLEEAIEEKNRIIALSIEVSATVRSIGPHEYAWHCHVMSYETCRRSLAITSSLQCAGGYGCRIA